jgi:dihydroxyacetone kinase-like predicted kinase
VSEGQLVPLDRIAIQHALEVAGGESVLVVGDPEALHIHVHLEDPGPAFSIGVAAGELRNVKVDNMQFQHEAWAAAQRTLPRVGVVAVAPGAGIAAAFRELGAVPLVFPDGRKPSASEFLQAARTAGSDHVFLLPNDKDAVMAAETAAREAPEFVSVIPTRSLVAGIAAAVGYVAGASADDLRGAMLAAAANARCVEVTRAARAATLDGIAVALDEPIALVDGRLVAAAASVEDALVAGLEYALTPGSELIIVYLGADAPDGSAALVERLAQRFPELTVETVEGGQPHYPYVAGVE